MIIERKFLWNLENFLNFLMLNPDFVFLNMAIWEHRKKSKSNENASHDHTRKNNTQALASLA